MEKFGEVFIAVNPVFVVIGIPFNSEYTSMVVLSVCTDFSRAKAFHDQVLENSPFFIDVIIESFDLDTLNDFYL